MSDCITVRLWSAITALTAVVLMLCSGCRSVRPPAEAHPAVAAPGHWHGVAVLPRPDLPRIRAIDKLNPVWWAGNLDDPKPPEWYLPKGHLRKLRWFARNSFHNFHFYVFGVADKPFVRCGKYPERIGTPEGGWNIAVTKYKRLRLPFVAFEGKKIEWYFGWRNNGNFGIALRHTDRAKMALAKPAF